MTYDPTEAFRQWKFDFANDAVGAMGDLILLIIVAAIMFFVAIGMGFVLKGLDRRIHARLQARIGPPLSQPILDFKKLMVKETIIPEDAVPWVYNRMPVLAVIASLSVLLYIPLFGMPAILGSNSDLILIIYLLTIPAIAMVIGGFASGTPLAGVGAQREMVAMMTYELPFSAVLISLGFLMVNTTGGGSPFDLNSFAGTGLWDMGQPFAFVGLWLLLLTTLFISPAMLAKIPFDAGEAETELGGGLFADYSGRNMAMFELSDAIKTFAVSALIVAIFFPHSLALGLGVENATLGHILDALWFMVKVSIVTLAEITVTRTIAARLKIDQIAALFLFPVACVAFLGMALIWIQVTM